MNKYDMLEKLQDAGVDVGAELVYAMHRERAEKMLTYIAKLWDVDLDESATDAVQE